MPQLVGGWETHFQQSGRWGQWGTEFNSNRMHVFTLVSFCSVARSTRRQLALEWDKFPPHTLMECERLWIRHERNFHSSVARAWVFVFRVQGLIYDLHKNVCTYVKKSCIQSLLKSHIQGVTKNSLRGNNLRWINRTEWSFRTMSQNAEIFIKIILYKHTCNAETINIRTKRISHVREFCSSTPIRQPEVGRRSVRKSSPPIGCSETTETTN